MLSPWCQMNGAHGPDDSRGGFSDKPDTWGALCLLGEGGKDITAPGQILIRTFCQFVGYWKQPDFATRVLCDGRYFPGDFFEFDVEGRWCHRGRSGDMLKVSGQRVSPTDIEACALTAADVQDASAVGFPNQDGLTRIALLRSAAQSRNPPGGSHRDVVADIPVRAVDLHVSAQHPLRLGRVVQ